MEVVENLVKTTLGEIEKVLSTRTVVGEPITIQGTTLIPLISIGFGFGAGGGEGKALGEIIYTINRLGLEITTLHIEHLPETIKKDVCVHINSEDVSQLIAELQSKGYPARLRQR